MENTKDQKQVEEGTQVQIEQFGPITRDDIGILGKNGGSKSQNSEEQAISTKPQRRDMGDFL